MEALKAVVLLVVFVPILATSGYLLSDGDTDGEMVTVENWQGYPLRRGITIRLADLIKQPRAQQFHGLMGRSLGTSQSVRVGRTRNNNKGEMFVGLMGRRLSEDIKEEWKSEDEN